MEDGKLWLNNSLVGLCMIGKDTTLIDRLDDELAPKVTDVLTTKDGYLISTINGIYLLNKSLKLVKRLAIKKGYMGSVGLLRKESGEAILYGSVGFFRILRDEIFLPNIKNKKNRYCNSFTRKQNSLWRENWFTFSERFNSCTNRSWCNK